MVRQFLTDKYVNKKWVNTKMKHEPVWLYENRKNKYDKFVKKTMKALRGDISEEEDQNDSDQEPQKQAQKTVKQPISQPARPQKAVQKPTPSATTDLGNLISFDTKPAVADGFTDFQDAQPSSNPVNDGFTNFQNANNMPQQ